MNKPQLIIEEVCITGPYQRTVYLITNPETKECAAFTPIPNLKGLLESAVSRGWDHITSNYDLDQRQNYPASCLN